MTNASAPSDKILSLISHLAAMTTENGCTEAEAATAASKMQKLLFDHNLSMADISTGDKTAEEIAQGGTADIAAMMRTMYGNRRIRPNARQWLVTLASSVARYNFCRILVRGENEGVIFVGSKANCAAAQAIFEFLAAQIMRLADEGYKADPLAKMTDSRIWRRNFSYGAASRVSNRLYENWKAMQEQSGVGTALVISNTAELEKFMGGFGMAKSYKSSGHGTREGIAAGDRVNLGNALK